MQNRTPRAVPRLLPPLLHWRRGLGRGGPLLHDSRLSQRLRPIRVQFSEPSPEPLLPPHYIFELPATSHNRLSHKGLANGKRPHTAPANVYSGQKKFGTLRCRTSLPFAKHKSLS